MFSFFLFFVLFLPNTKFYGLYYDYSHLARDGHYRRRRNKVATGIKLYTTLQTAVIYAHSRRRRRKAINSSAQDNACGRFLSALARATNTNVAQYRSEQSERKVCLCPMQLPGITAMHSHEFVINTATVRHVPARSNIVKTELQPNCTAAHTSSALIAPSALRD